MSDLEKYAEEQSAASVEFKAAYEEETARLALIRARNEAELSQKDVADALSVSQPYIAQVERGSRPMSLSLMVRYAEVVGVKIYIAPKAKGAKAS